MSLAAPHRVSERQGRWWPRLWLLLGMFAGGLLAGFNLLQAPPAKALPEAAVARVGEHLILRDEWLKAVAAVASERRTPLTAADQQLILNRLIDEELLVQHGLALGLVQKDQRLRGQLVSEVMLAAQGSAATDSADEATLKEFYERNADLFAAVGRLEVQAWRLDGEGQRQPFSPPIPQALLPPAKLRNYLGPALTQVAMGLPVGATKTIADGDNQVHLQVLRREPAPSPAFEDIRKAVQAEFQRQQHEAAVRALLRDLRQQHPVQLREQSAP